MKGYLDRSRRCRESIEKKLTSMDRESVEDLSTRQNVSRWIEKLSRSYRNKFQKAQWIEIALTSIEKGRSKILMDSQLSRAVENLLRLLKNSFSRREKHIYECNQTCNSTKDPNNILISQKHLLIKKNVRTRDYLTLLITNTSHKAHLLSCAQRCSSKLQMIQSLENFISIAIQGTQVPMYTKHTLFLYFSDFSIFFLIFMKNKIE